MIGISCPPLSLRPFSEVKEEILAHFKLWEIISEADHFFPDIKDEARQLLETTDIKMSVHASYSDVNIAAFDEGTRKYSIDVLRRTFAAASDLDMDVVTIHPGTVGAIQRWDRQRVVRLTRKSLEEISAHAAEYSTTIAFENMPDMRFAICKTASEMEEMLNGLDLKVCFDIGHAHTTGQLDEMMRLKPLFRNVHIHDNDGTRDEHLTLGEGSIDLEGVLRKLDGYEHDIIIESTSLESAVKSKVILEGLRG